MRGVREHTNGRPQARLQPIVARIRLLARSPVEDAVQVQYCCAIAQGDAPAVPVNVWRAEVLAQRQPSEALVPRTMRCFGVGLVAFKDEGKLQQHADQQRGRQRAHVVAQGRAITVDQHAAFPLPASMLGREFDQPESRSSVIEPASGRRQTPGDWPAIVR